MALLGGVIRTKRFGMFLIVWLMDYDALPLGNLYGQLLMMDKNKIPDLLIP